MRIIDFTDGFTSASAPTGVASGSVTGSLGSPTLITAAGGISPLGVSEEVLFVAGNGSAINITAVPQIAAGTAAGQRLLIIGTSDSNTVTIEEDTDLIMNGDCILKAGSIIEFNYNGSKWGEVSRNDI